MRADLVTGERDLTDEIGVAFRLIAGNEYSRSNLMPAEYFEITGMQHLAV